MPYFPDDFLFEPSQLTLNFGPDDTRLNVTVTIFDDDRVESDETFNLAISIPPNPISDYSPGSIPQTTISIIDDECKLLTMFNPMQL